MKKILLLLSLVFAFRISMAHPKNRTSELNLKLYTNEAFSVMLDHQVTYTASESFCFSNLTPGIHHLKVIRLFPRHGGCGIKKVVFNGAINIPPKSKLFALINLYHEFVVYSIVKKHAEPVCSTDENVFYESDFTQSPVVEPSFYSDNFSHLKNSIERAVFDNDKLTIAKQGITSNGISSQQVLELMSMLTFESNKVKLAKFAYPYTFDKQNFFIVNQGFTFSGSIRELNDFIAMY